MTTLHLQEVSQIISSATARILHLLQTYWLFTFSDLKTIVIPSTLFGITQSFLVSRYNINIQDREEAPLVGRWILALLWVWINLLPFNIANQRTPSAIAEDSINKPWRPLPIARISPEAAKTNMICLYVLAQVLSALVTGGLRQSFSLILLGLWYNTFGGADHHPLVRNAINALGYVCFTSGAMEVTTGVKLEVIGSSYLVREFGIIAGTIFTTVHAQDMYDQEGDSLRGRRTIPLVIGDVPLRWLILIWMLVWGVWSPILWGCQRLREDRAVAACRR